MIRKAFAMHVNARSSNHDPNHVLDRDPKVFRNVILAHVNTAIATCNHPNFHFDVMDFCECCSKEVIKFFWCSVYLKPQDSFGEFNKTFSWSTESAGNHQKNTTRHSCNCFDWHMVMQHCAVANYHYVHNLWQSVRGDSEHLYVLIISWKWKHFGANR